MRLGIVSDTHGHVDYAKQAVRMLESIHIDRVLHCGDVGSKEVVELFAPWRTDFVVGNCDHHPERMAEIIAEAGQTCHGTFGELHLDEKRIALLHGDDRSKFLEVTEYDQYDLVCYGHTHVAAIDRRGRTLIVNPGALYRANPHSLAIVDLTELEASIITL
jgi:putative phosphoesterase